MIGRLRDRARFWRAELDKFHSALQGRMQGAPLVLEGEQIGTLRSQLISTPEVSYRAGICNAGLLKTANGYLAVAKNNTYCFCHEQGVESDFGPGDPARSRLLLVELDEALRVTRVARLVLEIEGRKYDDELHLLEDARLTTLGKEVWCSMNLVPAGNPWGAVPVLGRLDVREARIVTSHVRVPDLRPPQKNWIPFVHDDALYVEYSINPHRVWRIEPTSLAVREQHSTRFISGYFGPRGPFYRGSAPPVRYDDSYLGAAHSMVLVGGRRNYRTHFFVADPNPPFKIRWFGRPVKLLDSARIQYVSAIVVGDKDDILVSYGLDDCDNIFARLAGTAIRATLRRA